MANFASYPKGDSISQQTITVPANDIFRVGLWGFQEGAGGPALAIMTTPVINWTAVRDEGVTRVYSFWTSQPGEVRIEAVSSARAVWDSITVNFSKVAAHKKVAQPGNVPADVLNAAILSRRNWGILVSVTLAQWALESNWGTQMPANSNNPFGIKAVPGQPYSLAETPEEINKQRVQTQGKFRVFASLDEAFNTHGRLLATNPVYANAMAVRDDPDAFVDALTGVYASASNYGQALKTWMRVYNLYQYDKYGYATPYIFPDEMQTPSW